MPFHKTLKKMTIEKIFFLLLSAFAIKWWDDDDINNV